MQASTELPRPDQLGGPWPGVWALRGASHRVHSAGLPPRAAPFKLVLQRAGTAHVQQSGRSATLGDGELTLVDGAQPFSIDMPRPFDQVLVALPRQAVLQRHRGLAMRTAVSRGAEAGDALLRDFVLALALRGAQLSVAGRLHGAAALVQLLGALDVAPVYDPRAALRHRALALMELDIADTGAEPLAAQLRVSRRYLDGVFAETGRSLGRHLWDRRLQLASERLVQADTSVTALAHALGFKDASHFSRLFRQHFGCTPTRWRATRGVSRAG